MNIKMNEKAWHYLSGEVTVTARLSRSEGFRYVTPEGGTYECSVSDIVPWSCRPTVKKQLCEGGLDPNDYVVVGSSLPEQAYRPTVPLGYNKRSENELGDSKCDVEMRLDTFQGRQLNIMLDIIAERRRQDVMFGDTNHSKSLEFMMVVLGEEFGEACQALLSSGCTGKPTDKDCLRTEMVQVAAVAVAIMERLDAASAKT